MTRAPDGNSSQRPSHPCTPSDRVLAPQAPDAVELSPDAHSHALLLTQQHASFGFISSWIAQHAGPCTISHSSTPPQTPLQNHRSASYPVGPTAADALGQPHAQGLHSRLLSAPSADADRLSDAFPHYPYPPPSVCSANSAQGEPSSQCSINSIHSYPSNQPAKSKQQPSYYRHRGVHQPHSHMSAGGSGTAHAAGFSYKSHQSSKHNVRQNQRRSYSGSPFSSSGVHHAPTKSNAASWRSSSHVQLPHAPPPAHVRPMSSYEARHLSSPPCLPQQPPPPALPEAYALPRHSGRHRSIHYSHPAHHTYSAADHIPGPPPLPEATAVSAWGNRPPPPPMRHGPQRHTPPPPPPAASAGPRSASQPNSLHASPHPDPLVMQQRDAPPPPPLPQTPPHERPHTDLDRFLQAVDRLWAAPPPPPAPADRSPSLKRDVLCSQDHLDGVAAGRFSRQPSDPASPSDRECLHRPCNPLDHSNGSEGNDTIDSVLPEAGGATPPAPATLADVWSRVRECSAFGLEVPCSAKGSFSCAYFVPHLSALHIVATVPPDDAHAGGLDTLFYDGASPLPSDALRAGRMHECAVDEAATDGTAEDSGTDAHAIGGDGETVPSPGAGGMFTDSSEFLHSGAPSTSRGSVMHEAFCNTDSGTPERCLSRADLSDLPAVYSSRVDDAIVTTSPRALAQPTTKASLRLVANWAAEGPSWERPPLYLHVQELCGAAGALGCQARTGAVSGHASPVPAVPAVGVPPQGRSASAASTRVPGIPCPAALSATPLRHIHPSSWFAILWHPLCRIPDADLRARFITYHEVGCAGIEGLQQHGSGSSAAAAAAGGGTSGGLSGATATGPPPLPTGMQGAPRIVGALVDIGDDGGNWLVPTLVGPDGCVHQCAPGEERQSLVAMLRGAADALSKSTLFAESSDGPQALPFVHHDHKFVSNLQET